MYLRDLASSICSRKEDLADRDRHITVRNHDSNLRHNVLWEGKAKDLATFEHIGGWIVVEVLIDKDDTSHPCDYNKGKIITVV